MNGASILETGYCSCALQEKLSLIRENTGNECCGIYDKGQRYLKNRENPFCVDVTFLIAYSLLKKEEFFCWQEKVPIKAKVEWRKSYLLSKYHNEFYECFFDIRGAADLDWLTGMMIKIKQGGRKEYWELLNGISQSFPWEHQYIEKRGQIQLESLLEIADREENIILKAGRLLILFILIEFYQKQIPRSEQWHRADYMIMTAMEVYQCSNSNHIFIKKDKQFQRIVNENFLSHGIHPVRLQKYVPLKGEFPEYQRVKREDWEYLWSMIIALEKCICDNKKLYGELKRNLEKKSLENSSKE